MQLEADNAAMSAIASARFPPLLIPRALPALRLLCFVLLLWSQISAYATDPAKVIRIAMPYAETSFDPAFANDDVSLSVTGSIIEPMLDYDYLVRPVKLVPRTLDSMPVVEEGGKAFICKLKKGIFFTRDPAFKGKPRELTATDYAYGLKRLLDPAVKSPWRSLLEEKLIGGDALQAKAKTGKFDYDAGIAGLEIVDRYTLKIRLKNPDYRFLYVLAMPATAAVAREVVETYGNDIGAHPIGTGPFALAEYKRSSRISLIANPSFREVTYAPAGSVPPASQSIAAALNGKQLPFAGRIDISIIEEGQARWLAFLNGELDFLDQIPIEFIENALVDGKLKPDLARRGIRHQTLVRPSVTYTTFNMEDPVVGGYAPDKIALRRAISMSFNTAEEIRSMRNGRGVRASGPIPPDVEGFDPNQKAIAQAYDPAAARAMLDKFSYKDRDRDGYRELPDGKPLLLELWSAPTSLARLRDELWKKSLDAVGLRIEFRKGRVPELIKLARAGKFQMLVGGWLADYPDAEVFMQLLYGANIGRENSSRFNLPEFNRLFEDTKGTPDSAARTKLFSRMTELVVNYAPWRIGLNPVTDVVHHAWIRNYVPHPILPQAWSYIDMDAELRARRP
jgi:oligopeptide transport system substrate-binding protein